MHPKDINISSFDYILPDEKIATHPLQPRDESKLLVYKNGQITDSKYYDLANFIPENALLIFNETKVIYARLLFYKDTGAKIEVFCLEPDNRYPDIQTAMTTTQSVYWKCMVGGAAKWKTDQEIFLNINENLTVAASIIEKLDGTFLLHFNWNEPSISFAEILHLAGKVPLPPYLNRIATEEDKNTYQTIFAKEEGSVAAPTAALHFTDNILQRLSAKNIQQDFVTLHVGAGTFKPVKADTMEGHDMHAEWLEVKKDLIIHLINHIKSGHPIFAVGTTSTRTLESLYWIGVQLLQGNIEDLHTIAVPQWMPYEKLETNSLPTVLSALTSIVDYLIQNNLEKLVTKTQIIIAPGYQYRIIDGIMTNFHQPKSTLLLLVSALIGEKWHELYTHALQNEYRFLSYGDGSLLFNSNVIK